MAILSYLTHTHARTHAHTHTCTHAHTHMHARTQWLSRKLSFIRETGTNVFAHERCISVLDFTHALKHTLIMYTLMHTHTNTHMRT